MKKTLLLSVFLPISIFSMEQSQVQVADASNSTFDFATFLTEHKWRERKDALSADQRDELVEYLRKYGTEVDQPLSSQDLSVVLIKGLNEVERVKNPEELQDMLYNAILSDCPQDITRAIKAGASVKRKRGDKEPLLLAVLLKKPNAVGTLIDIGANIDQKHAQYALEMGDMKTASLLAVRGKLLDGCYPARLEYQSLQGGGSGLALIHHAMAQGDFQSALFLLKNNAPFNVSSLNNEMRLMDYIFKHIDDANIDAALELLQWLINNGYKVDYFWETGLIHRQPAVYPCEANVFHSKENHPITSLIFHKKMIDFFLKNGANPNHIIDLSQAGQPHGTRTWTPLHRAVLADSKNGIEALLTAGADMNQKGSIGIGNTRPTLTPLSFAIFLGREKIVECLLKYSATL